MSALNPFDIAASTVLVATVFWGGMRGVVSQIAGVASWVVAWTAAARFGGTVAPLLPLSEPWRRPVAALIVFLATAVGISFASKFLKRALSLAGLKEFDRQAGALFGGIKGALICVVAAFFGTIVSEATRHALVESKSGPFFVSIASVVVSKTCGETELGRSFLQTAESTFGAKRTSDAAKTLDSEVDDLKSYLKKNVFSSTAKEIVEGADVAEAEEKTGATSGGAARSKRSLWDVFRNAVQRENPAETDVAPPAEVATPGESTINEPTPSGADSLAAFFKRTLGIGSTTSDDATFERAAGAKSAPTSSGASTGARVATNASNFLDEFIGVAPENAASKETDEEKFDADSGHASESVPFWSGSAFGAPRRLRILPPATYR